MINALPEIFHSPITFFSTLTLGFVIGGLFFLSLWWVVSIGLISQHPARWFVISFFLRISFCLLSFYAVADGNPQRLVVALTGFIIARPAIKLLIGQRILDAKTKVETHDAT